MPDSSFITTLLSDGMWFFVIVGWIVLIAAGLEADKPLSGGLPGHVDAADVHGKAHHWKRADKIGAFGAWLVFGLAALMLPVILWWILSVHAG